MLADTPTTPLGDLVESYDFKRVPVRQSDRTKGPYPYYGASGIVDHVDGYLFDGEYLLIAEDGENLRTRQTPIAFLARGKFWVNNHAHIVKANSRADIRFLMYALQMANVDAFISGSTMPKLTQQSLNRIPIPAFPLPIQRRIAHILGTLDDKIELNGRMNATLEDIMRALFKSWFVDFGPVRANAAGRDPGLPADIAALFPAALVESELGEIPAGWGVERLPVVFEVNPTRSLPAGKPAVYLEMANMPTTGARATEWVVREAGSGMRFMNGDTLVARITPCLENGKTAFVDFLEDGEVGWGSTEYIVLRSKPPLPLEYAYYFARMEGFRAYAIANMNGTSGRQRVAASSLDSYPVVVPGKAVAAAFGKIANGFLRKMKNNDEQSATLAALRDTLLPRLLAGEVHLRE